MFVFLVILLVLSAIKASERQLVSTSKMATIANNNTAFVQCLKSYKTESKDFGNANDEYFNLYTKFHLYSSKQSKNMAHPPQLIVYNCHTCDTKVRKSESRKVAQQCS